MLFTDGPASDKQFLQRAREAWINNGVHLFAIGIGDALYNNHSLKMSGMDWISQCSLTD